MEFQGGQRLGEVSGCNLRVVRYRGRDRSSTGQIGRNLMKQAGENLFELLPSVWQSLSLLFLSLFVAIVVIANHAPQKVAEKQPETWKFERSIDGR